MQYITLIVDKIQTILTVFEQNKIDINYNNVYEIKC